MTGGEAETLVLDHAGLVSRRPQEVFAAYERMGFRLTPLSRHVGAARPGAAPKPWGTGNRCAMFRRGYLELLGIFEPNRYCGPFPALADRYEGLHVMAFASPDITALERRLRARGVGVEGVLALERAVDLPDGPGTARFSLLQVSAAEEREGHLILIQHHTPDSLWQPRYLDHPNGALSLDELLLCVRDPDEAAQRYGRILGAKAARRGAVRRFDLPAGRFALIGADDLAGEIAGLRAPALPFVAAVTFGVRSIERVAGVLDGIGVDFARESGRISVPAEAGGGAVCVFATAEATR